MINGLRRPASMRLLAVMLISLSLSIRQYRREIVDTHDGSRRVVDARRDLRAGRYRRADGCRIQHSGRQCDTARCRPRASALSRALVVDCVVRHREQRRSHHHEVTEATFQAHRCPVGHSRLVQGVKIDSIDVAIARGRDWLPSRREALTSTACSWPDPSRSVRSPCPRAQPGAPMEGTRIRCGRRPTTALPRSALNHPPNRCPIPAEVDSLPAERAGPVEPVP